MSTATAHFPAAPVSTRPMRFAETAKPFASLPLRLAESGLLPDALVRAGIRRLLAKRLVEEQAGSLEACNARKAAFVASMRSAPLALETDAANAQHYELPAAFMQAVLGPRLKYSCGLWPEAGTTFAQSEEAALSLVAGRAQLSNGQRILELGCGWGSLTLWMAEHYPASRITAVSNSALQRAFIEARAKERGLSNVEVITCDINRFEFAENAVDRVVSIEMFEHLRNWAEAFRRVSHWLKPGGKFFMHVFTHKTAAYPFQVEGEDDWMGRYFFTGGMIPSDDLPLHFQDHLRIENRWAVNGCHYEKTANAWLENQDRRKAELMPLFDATYGSKLAAVWFQRWRMFFMACAELWGYQGGDTWGVGHYLLAKPSPCPAP